MYQIEEKSYECTYYIAEEIQKFGAISKETIYIAFAEFVL
jgi:hypothetical protein